MSNGMAQLQEATIKAHCKVLRMPMMAAQFGTLADQAIREKKSHIGYLEALRFGSRGTLGRFAIASESDSETDVVDPEIISRELCKTDIGGSLE